MKIYFLLPDLSAGGAERVSITIARLLCKEGYNVEFVNFGFRVGEIRIVSISQVGNMSA